MIRALVIVLALSTAASAQTTVKRGITGEMTFAYDGPELIAVLEQELSAPILLRLERSGADEYTARFIGAVEGDYDLRSLIRHRRGTEPTDLPPLDVRVVSNLPDRFQTDLYDAADLRPTLASGYWRALAVLAVVWLAVPVVAIIRRLTRPRPVEEHEEVPAEPTLADQLRPLVVAASERDLSLSEQARLELLLVHFWRERIAPDAPDVAAAIGVIRHHPEAGELLGAVESWLHRPEPDAHDPARLDALLAPYRSASAMPERAPADMVVTS